MILKIAAVFEILLCLLPFCNVAQVSEDTNMDVLSYQVQLVPDIGNRKLKGERSTQLMH